MKMNEHTLKFTNIPDLLYDTEEHLFTSKDRNVHSHYSIINEDFQKLLIDDYIDEHGFCYNSDDEREEEEFNQRELLRIQAIQRD